MAVYAVVESLSKSVVNLVEWDGEASWCFPSDCFVIPSDKASIGGTYLNGDFIPPVVESLVSV